MLRIEVLFQLGTQVFASVADEVAACPNAQSMRMATRHRAPRQSHGPSHLLDRDESSHGKPFHSAKLVVLTVAKPTERQCFGAPFSPARLRFRTVRSKSALLCAFHKFFSTDGNCAGWTVAVPSSDVCPAGSAEWQRSWRIGDWGIQLSFGLATITLSQMRRWKHNPCRFPCCRPEHARSPFGNRCSNSTPC
jgi:hypothetical protein